MGGRETVAVLEHNPVFANGLSLVLLEHDFHVQVLRGHSIPHRRPIWDAVLLGMDCSGCRQLIVRLDDIAPDIATIGLLSLDEPGLYGEAFLLGVSACVCRRSPPEQFAVVVRQALEGFSTMPVPVARTLGVLIPRLDEAPLGVEEKDMLRAIAEGQTVRELAVRLNYSERAVHRKLRSLYDLIGAANRAQAIAFAVRWGFGGLDRGPRRD